VPLLGVPAEKPDTWGAQLIRRLRHWWDVTTSEDFRESSASRRGLRWLCIPGAPLLLLMSSGSASARCAACLFLAESAAAIVSISSLRPARWCGRVAIWAEAEMLTILAAVYAIVVVATGPQDLDLSGVYVQWIALLGLLGFHSSVVLCLWAVIVFGTLAVGNFVAAAPWLFGSVLILLLAASAEYSAAQLFLACRNNEKVVEALLDSTADGLCTVDSETGKVSGATPFVEQLLASKSESLMQFLDLFDSADRALVQDTLVRAQLTSTFASVIVRCTAPAPWDAETGIADMVLPGIHGMAPLPRALVVPGVAQLGAPASIAPSAPSSGEEAESFRMRLVPFFASGPLVRLCLQVIRLQPASEGPSLRPSLVTVGTDAIDLGMRAVAGGVAVGTMTDEASISIVGVAGPVGDQKLGCLAQPGTELDTKPDLGLQASPRTPPLDAAADDPEASARAEGPHGGGPPAPPILAAPARPPTAEEREEADAPSRARPTPDLAHDAETQTEGGSIGASATEVVPSIAEPVLKRDKQVETSIVWEAEGFACRRCGKPPTTKQQGPSFANARPPALPPGSRSPSGQIGGTGGRRRRSQRLGEGTPPGGIGSSVGKQGSEGSGSTEEDQTEFEPTRAHSAAISLLFTMKHWSLPHTHSGCCAFHASVLLAKGLIKRILKDPCNPHWYPLAGWQCRICTCMNHESAPRCDMCGEANVHPDSEADSDGTAAQVDQQLESQTELVQREEDTQRARSLPTLPVEGSPLSDTQPCARAASMGSLSSRQLLAL